MRVLPIPGQLTLVCTTEKFTITSAPAGEHSLLSDMLSVVFQSTKPPLASILDNNWINRALTDISLAGVLELSGASKAIVWLMPEAYRSSAVPTIYETMLSNRWMISSRNCVWGKGYN